MGTGKTMQNRATWLGLGLVALYLHNAVPAVSAAVTLSAGLNQLVNKSDIVSLQGSITGLDALTQTKWAKVSGPGTVRFSDPYSLAPTASFSKGGVYVLSLRAYSKKTVLASSEVMITVNEPPRISLTSKLRVKLPAHANLAATVSDDGLPNPPGAVSVEWSMVNGPGPVTFENAQSATTKAKFSAAGAYVLSLSANDGKAVTEKSIAVSVLEAPPANLTYSVNPAIYIKGTPIAVNAPSSTGGPVQSYSISGELPAGLQFDSVTGVLSGTPSEIQRATGYRIIAKNSGGKTAAKLSITVNDVPPSQLNYAKNPAVYKRGVVIEPNVPSANGGAITKFTLNRSLPSGLRFDSKTGVISGVPKTLSAQAVYEISAFNSGGSAKTQLSIAVSDIAAPSIAYSASAHLLTIGSAVLIPAPANSGGAISSYAINPALPAGLAFSTSTGEISGTPTEAILPTPYRITATNSGGSTSVTVLITINEIVTPPVLATTLSNSLLFSNPVISFPVSVISKTGVQTSIYVNGEKISETSEKELNASVTLRVGKNDIRLEAIDSMDQAARPLAFSEIVFSPPALTSGVADPAVISPAFNMPSKLSEALLEKISLTTQLTAWAKGRTDEFSCSNGLSLEPPSNEVQNLADLDPMAEVTPEIQRLADRLGSVDQAYFYVRDQITFLPRFGITQTAMQTLGSGTGTSADKAAALIALFRAMGIPARYVAGDVLVSEDQLKGLYGVSGAKDLAWAQYVSLKGYFQSRSPEGFDGSSMISYQRGSRAWCSPQI